MATGLAVLFALILVNAFFVAGEYALVRVRRTRMEALAAKGNGAARVVLHGLDHINRHVAGVQVGITFAGLASGRFGEPALALVLDPVFAFVFPASILGTAASDALGTAGTLLAITFLLVVLSELVPKAITLRHAERVALLVARPLRFVVRLFTPLVWTMNHLGNGVLRLLRLESPSDGDAAHSVDELKLLVLQSEKAGVLESLERRLASKSFDLGELRASDVLIPRLDIDALDARWPAETLLDRAAQSSHTRLPVYDGNRDEIVGILHLQDLFRATRGRAAGEALDVRRIARAPLFVPAAIRLDALLRSFQEKRTQIAIVLDEHGGLSGLVTLEDIVEEVFGEVQDALEADRPAVRRTEDGRILIRGDVRLRDLNEELGIRLEDDEADTIAGYVIVRLGRHARPGDEVGTAHGAIRVENMARLRITEVSLRPRIPG